MDRGGRPHASDPDAFGDRLVERRRCRCGGILRAGAAPWRDAGRIACAGDERPEPFSEHPGVSTPPVEVVFFDIGGVLYDDTVYARSWMRALREHGAYFSDEE